MPDTCAAEAAPSGLVVCAARAIRPCPDGGPIGVQFLDIWSRMQRERIMYIGQDLDDEYANQVCLGCSVPEFCCSACSGSDGGFGQATRLLGGRAVL